MRIGAQLEFCLYKTNVGYVGVNLVNTEKSLGVGVGELCTKHVVNRLICQIMWLLQVDVDNTCHVWTCIFLLSTPLFL